ncbi:MAG TPA: hypothetical protein VM261_17705 [Kofleriaceae bacterium]|nr:hypothetical protein [Kofleriaceae bacterium]
MRTVFLLSPARCGGPRAQQLAASASALGVQLRGEGAPLGDVFAWLSALYFRGKLTYAQRFGSPLVMAPGLGLCAPSTSVSVAALRTMGEVAIESRAFVEPLRRDAEQVKATFGARTRVVLLGSIATSKYVDTLMDVFGARLLFPGDFVGRGDMSRGGLLLRAAKSGDELAYQPIAGATRHGVRPPKLPPLTRRGESQD